MANVKVPPLLHKRSKTSQIAWYKANKMPLPSHLTGGGGYSAAQAKKDVGELNKQKAKEKAAAIKPVDRMELIKRAAEKRAGRTQVAKLRSAFGGEVPGARYDDPLAMARAGMPIKGYRLGEAAKPDASMVMTDTLKKQMISDKDKQTLAKVANLMANLKNKDKKNEYVRQVGLSAMKAGKIDPARGHSPTRFGREVLNKEENQMNEVTKQEAEKVLGGPVKEKPKMPSGKQPEGYRYVRSLARKAMKAGLKKEEVEQINEGPSHFLYTGEVNGKPYEYTVRAHSDLTDDAVHKALKRDNDHLEPHEIKAIVDSGGEEESHVEVDHKGKKYTHHVINNQEPDHLYEEVEQIIEQDDTMEKKEMAQTQLHFIKYAAEEILAFIDMGGEIEEWYQNKLSKVQSEVESLHSYIEGEKRRTGMVKEDEEQIDEKAPPGAKFERMVKHIKKGYAKDGLTKQEKSIAYATAWKAYNKKNEETETEGEQIEEKYMGFKALKASIAAKGGARDPAAVAAAIGRKKYGKEKFQAMAAAGKKANEEVEQVAEAEGKVAVTPKEKALAAHHGDKTKITYGDVVKARIKSAAEKAMNKGK